MDRESQAANLVLHPVALCSLFTLLLNDHWLKGRAPSLLTGKLSDVAALVLVPLLVMAVLTHCGVKSRHMPWLTCIGVGLGFTALECWAPADWLFRWGLALLQWPLRALAQGSLVRLAPVAHVADVGDLWTLPALAIALITERRVR